MSAHTHEEIKKHVTIYVRVFAALMALTVVTVGVSYLHLPLAIAIALALFIATIKAGLVASFFMHLAFEKRLIFIILILTVFFFIFLLTSPALHYL